MRALLLIAMVCLVTGCADPGEVTSGGATTSSLATTTSATPRPFPTEPGDHVLPDYFDGQVQIIDQHGADLVVWGETVCCPGEEGGTVLISDRSALFDHSTMTWRSFETPFDQPTSGAVGGVVGDELVIIGVACTVPDDPLSDGSTRECDSTNEWQAADLDLNTGIWSRHDVPLDPPEVGGLSAMVVGDQLLVGQSSDSDVATRWATYDAANDSWATTSAPPITPTADCFSGRDPLVIEISHLTPSGWVTPSTTAYAAYGSWDGAHANSVPSYSLSATAVGRVRVSRFDPLTQSWGAPSAEVIPQGVPGYVDVRCAGGIVDVLACDGTYPCEDAWTLDDGFKWIPGQRLAPERSTDEPMHAEGECPFSVQTLNGRPLTGTEGQDKYIFIVCI